MVRGAQIGPTIAIVRATRLGLNGKVTQLAASRPRPRYGTLKLISPRMPAINQPSPVRSNVKKNLFGIGMLE